MSALVIPFHEKFIDEVKEIFYESSTRKDFKDELEKEAFFQKYVGYYLKNYPELCFLALDKKVLGYIVASPQSSALELHSLQPHLESFAAHLKKYPAHLHINCHVDSRGKGIGQILVKKVIKELSQQKIIGLHIMTGPDSQNVHFYRKLGFIFETVEKFNSSPILFMGKGLSDD